LQVGQFGEDPLDGGGARQSFQIMRRGLAGINAGAGSAAVYTTAGRLEPPFPRR
jgi:hypothetical protein